MIIGFVPTSRNLCFSHRRQKPFTDSNHYMESVANVNNYSDDNDFKPETTSIDAVAAMGNTPRTNSVLFVASLV